MNISDFTQSDAPFQKFLTGYLEAMCFCDLPEEFVASGPFDMGDWANKLSPDLLKKATEDSVKFLEYAHDMVKHHYKMAGADLWFTRCGHGVGFWSREEVWGNDADTLKEIVQLHFSEMYLYIGDDDLLYIE